MRRLALIFVRAFASADSTLLARPIMRKSSFSNPLLATLATLFAGATILYSGLWMYNNTRQPPVELGFDDHYLKAEHCDLVDGVYSGSPAERAGLRAGDRIVEINGRPLENASYMGDVWAAHHPGDAVELTIQRAQISPPFVIKGVFRAPGSASKEGRVGEDVGQDIVNTFPIVFLVVGLAILFFRLEDPNAWLLALMFASTISIADPTGDWRGLGPSWRTFAMAYRTIFNGLDPPVFYFFFAVFPARSPLDRRAPWLKWAGLVLAFCWALPGLGTGDLREPVVLVRLVGEHTANLIRLSCTYGFVLLGFLSLIWNALRAADPEVRRKIRVILWGTLAGITPIALLRAAADFLGFRPHLPIWGLAVMVLLLFLFPLSFAYAVVKHRVLEIPVLLRRSARYLLVQRGFSILLALGSVAVTVAFALSIARYLEPLTRAAVPGGIALGTGFGTLLLWAGTSVHKGVGGRIDRAFFRNSYDARMILEDLTERTRTATDRQELAALIEHHLNQALQPISLVVYLETLDNQLSAARGKVTPQLETILATEPTLIDLTRSGQPREVPGERRDDTSQPFLLAALQPDCLVPMLGRNGRLVGLLVLGPRLSEESYSGEDKRLLASVASQAGVALESIRLGEKIAERIEADRRAAQEMEFARQVQTRLFPQELPVMETLEYRPACIPARQVGGDYYDFLELRPGRLGLVLADIAGKGVSGALLMANLQANLRSQYAMAVEDLPRLLTSVNRLFYRSTDEASYATLFFGDYDDSSRWLRYVNCGHLPPLLLRADGHLERLTATTTVLGLFEKWECAVAEVRLAAGDTIVLYTDGVTEAENPEGEQFGESRLIEKMLAQRHLPVPALLEHIVAATQKFSDGEQADDITLVLARCRS